MKRAFFLVLGIIVMLIATAPAFAQTAPAFNEPGFSCPMLKGKALDGGISISPPGLWSSHWCLGTDGKYHLRINAVQAQNAAAMAPDFMKLQNLEGSAYNDAMTAFMSKYPAANVKASDASVKDIWSPNQAAIFASKPADPVVTPPVTPPVVKNWIVAPNGTAKTRQWYPFSPTVGRTSTTGGGSVTIAGTACNPSVASVTEVGVVYAAFGPSFNPTRVTQCVTAP